MPRIGFEQSKPDCHVFVNILEAKLDKTELFLKHVPDFQNWLLCVTPRIKNQPWDTVNIIQFFFSLSLYFIFFIFSNGCTATISYREVNRYMESGPEM